MRVDPLGAHEPRARRPRRTFGAAYAEARRSLSVRRSSSPPLDELAVEKQGLGGIQVSMEDEDTPDLLNLPDPDFAVQPRAAPDIWLRPSRLADALGGAF